MFQDEGANNVICWERVWKKLVRYARLITGCPMDAGKEGPVVRSVGEAIDPEDLVVQVVTKFLDKADPDKLLTEKHVLNLLKRAVTNAHIDLLRKIENHKTDYAEDLIRPAEQGEGRLGFFEAYKANKVAGLSRHEVLSDPLPAPNEEDPQVVYLRQLRELYERVKGDTKLEEMVKAICMEGLEEPRDIASYLGVTRDDIYNRLKKLRRRYEDLLPPKLRRRKAV